MPFSLLLLFIYLNIKPVGEKSMKADLKRR